MDFAVKPVDFLNHLSRIIGSKSNLGPRSLADTAWAPHTRGRSSGGTSCNGGTSRGSVLGPGWGEQGDLVAAVGQPVGEQSDHPFDATVAAGRDGVSGKGTTGGSRPPLALTDAGV